MEKGKSARKLYKDSPWQGIQSGLTGSGVVEDLERNAVLIYTIPVDVEDWRQRQGNTPSTWHDGPIDFDFDRDAHIVNRRSPHLTLCSKRLTRIMELLMDYYPAHIGSYDEYTATTQDTFAEIMYYYAEMKAYLSTYSQSIREDDQDSQNDLNLDIGNCGDDKFHGAFQQQLDFGSLDLEKEPCDVTTAYDLAVLLRTLAPMYRDKVAPTLQSVFLDSEPRVSYESLWVLLRPGTYVYVQESAFSDSIQIRAKRRDYDTFSKGPDNPPDDNQLSAYVVSSWQYKNRSVGQHAEWDEAHDRLLVELWMVQYDTASFQRIRRQAIIFRFDGFRFIGGLEVIPANHYDRLDGGILRNHLRERGRRYLSIHSAPVAHREYDHPPSAYRGQIIIDPVAYAQYAYENDPIRRRSKNRLFPIADGNGGKRFRNFLDFQPSCSKNFSRIDEVVLLLPRRIEGLGLKTKDWMVFEIDNISDTAPKFASNQLDTELVLVSDDDKDALRTVLSNGEHSVSVTSDFVPGKGEGKIFLLYGPPGTGKTLTVECVANDTHRPLISLTAQDVSLIHQNAEAQLRKWFAIAAKWGAILLIDEADLFLEQRRAGDPFGNSLATIFLRSLEYYKGILFLTTNRPGHIDDSFISRITYPIPYKPLSTESKARIVNKFIRKFEETETIEVDHTATKYLIENCEQVNGRQIRNILHGAVALAEKQQRSEYHSAVLNGTMSQQNHTPGMISVRRHHVKSALSRQTEFMEYLKSLKGGRDEPTRARSRQDYLSAT